MGEGTHIFMLNLNFLQDIQVKTFRKVNSPAWNSVGEQSRFGSSNKNLKHCSTEEQIPLWEDEVDIPFIIAATKQS